MKSKEGESPESWLKSCDPSLLECDDTPLLGNAPSFPYEELSQKFSELFEIPDIKISPGEMRWREPHELYQDLGDHLEVVTVAASGFDGEVKWVMNANDLSFLMKALLTQSANPPVKDIPTDFQQGFRHFLALEMLTILPELHFDSTLNAHLRDNTDLPNETALGLSVQMSLYDHTLSGRLLISQTFRRSWKEHYSKATTPAHKQPLADQTPITLHIEIGHTEVAAQDWDTLAKGDLLLLDRCTLDPDSGEGTVVISHENHPVLHGQFNQGTIQITGPAFQHEVETPMDETPKEENPIEDEFEEESPVEEEPEEEEEELEDEEEEEEEGEDEQPAPQEEPDLTPVLDEKAISPHDVPLNVSIEIGRIQMSLQKLMELHQGNLLDLGVGPENGVKLVVGGRCVGKGELLKVDKTLGVRITEMGKSK